MAETGTITRAREKTTALHDLIEYAYREVAHFHSLISKLGYTPADFQSAADLRKLPFMTKDMIQQNISDFVAREYQRYPKSQKIEVKRTSGSTGKYLKIYWDRHDDIRSLFPLWKMRYRLYGIEPQNHFCTFYTANYKGNKIVEAERELLGSNGRTLGFSKVGLTHERLLEIYEKILEFNPDWFYLQPSVAVLLADLVSEEKLAVPSNLRYIETTGELLTKDCRERISSVFRAPLADMYGTNETNGIAFECPEHHHHVLTGNAIVEIIKDGKPVIGEEGDVFVTCLNNFAMPFIRYETGDRGTLIPSDCPCGNKEPIFIPATGRSTDLVLLHDGQRVSSYVLAGIIEYTNEYMEGVIKQYQFRQLDIDEFDVTIALKPAYVGWSEAVRDCFLENVKEPLLKDAKWHFHFVETIYPDEQTGKHKHFYPLKRDFTRK